ncbi:hypothetical protein [Chroococcidiopsis sp. CCMEE 29]|uniref:hypothetical protein n=1 Tax=Chroococcidiopsis sp. CCMEE 29 TaxID=155894 RepID=UPI00202264F3|nr:hypothetical protein [Chroococcidiopsis sp. CCMEE 29]
MPQLKPVNQKLLEALKPEQVELEIRRVEQEAEEGIEESELDEMWSYVSKKPTSGGFGMPSTARQAKSLLILLDNEKTKSFSSSNSC